MTLPSTRSVQFAKDAINDAMALLQRRWTLRVLWELGSAPMTFRALQTQCGEVSPSVLNQRLAELREAGLVERTEAGYGLTALGADLVVAFGPLSQWAVRWRRAVPSSA